MGRERNYQKRESIKREIDRYKARETKKERKRGKKKNGKELERVEKDVTG